MKKLSTLTLLTLALVFGLFVQATNAQVTVENLESAIQVAPEQEETQGSQEEEEDPGQPGQQPQDEESAAETPSDESEQPGNREIRLSLWDGTIVTGDVDIEYLKVETQFGKLEVPVKNIIQLKPGLDSFPALTEKITALVEQLDDRNFQTREQAHRKLVEMGPSIRSVVSGFEPGQSAERRKHLEKIREEFDEMLESAEEWEETSQSDELIRGDTIQTGDFTIVGKILQPEFILDSKYGQLTIALADIKTADRTWMQSAVAVTKTVEVKGNAFFQTSPVATKIRVNKGDRIRIRASGTVNWATWGNITSTPEGITNQGNWQNFNCGTLLARIGTGNDYQKIGNKNEFVAKSNGVLQLGIAMRDNYAQQNNYQWPGSYRARITVTPAEE